MRYLPAFRASLCARGDTPDRRIVGRAARRADHLVLAAPATPRTEHVIGTRELTVVKPGVYLVNIARGALVDQDALGAALDDGRVSTAWLDVCDPEPLPAGHWMYEHPKVRLSPHISWSNPKSRGSDRRAGRRQCAPLRGRRAAPGHRRPPGRALLSGLPDDVAAAQCGGRPLRQHLGSEQVLHRHRPERRVVGEQPRYSSMRRTVSRLPSGWTTT